MAFPPPLAIANRYSLAVIRSTAQLLLPFVRSDRVSVVIVNFNTLPFLREILVPLRREPSASRINVIVVDNGSTDGSREFLRAASDIRSICLKRNVGHAIAADLGFLVATSGTVLSLDVDAFPIKPNWLDDIVAPLEHGHSVSGVQLWRPYAHPCCLAMRKSRFVLRRHTFRSRYSHDRSALGHTAWDVGESISMREIRSGGAVNLVPVTSQRGPGDVGTVFGDCIYHNFYSSRHQASRETLIDNVSAADVERAWAEAVERYLRPLHEPR